MRELSREDFEFINPVVERVAKHYNPSLHSYLLADIRQEIWMKLLESNQLSKILEEHSTGYLYVTCNNIAIDLYRKETVRHIREEEYLSDIYDEDHITKNLITYHAEYELTPLIIDVLNLYEDNTKEKMYLVLRLKSAGLITNENFPEYSNIDPARGETEESISRELGYTCKSSGTLWKKKRRMKSVIRDYVRS